MLTPGRRRRPRREPAIAAGLLILVGIVVAVIALSSGGAPHTRPKPAPTPTAVRAPHRPAHHHRRAFRSTFLWPFYGYSGARSRDFGAPSGFGPPLRRGWTYNNFALLEFPPVLYHNALFFIGYNGLAKAVNKLNGHLIWRRGLGTLSAASPAIDPGRGLVFFPLLSRTRGARLPGNGRFVALSTKNGRIVWSRKVPAGSESSPLVQRGNVYFGDAGGTIYSFRAGTGHLNWTFQASGAVKGGLAYSAGHLYFGDYAGRVYSVNAANGHEVWASSLGGTIYGSAAVAFGKVYVGDTDHRVYALSKSSGRLIWDASTSDYVYSSPAAANVGGLGPTVYIGSYDGNFYALNAESGATRWSHASGERISGSGTIIGHVIYYGVLGVKNSIGLNTRTGREVFFYPDGAFASAVADHRALYLIGYSTIYQMFPRRRGAHHGPKRRAPHRRPRRGHRAHRH
ncbi:MAG TPA: PQQ-binding-like beta-propeller repeat protein [Solirubrobacteraceae bacterium]|jgi:outer membrane protein assembly factor BamB